MVQDSTTRFTQRVENYVRYRPGYPAAVADLLGRKGALVADVGCGTGLLSQVFLDAGYEVIGVEPNREMRRACTNVPTVDGRAEATTLPDRSVDLIVAGQAFHWFDVEPTKREWRRILRPGGRVALVWNHKLREGAFMRELEEIIDRFAEERDKDGEIREAGRGRIEGFFAPVPVQTAEFPNEQRFDFEGLRGRVLSSSYLPGEGEPGADELTSELETLFDRQQEDGHVRLLYRTKVYWAELDPCDTASITIADSSVAPKAG